MVFDLRPDVRLILREFIAEPCRDINDLRHVIHNIDFTKNDDTFDIKRPLPLFAIPFIIGAKRHLAVFF